MLFGIALQKGVSTASVKSAVAVAVIYRIYNPQKGDIYLYKYIPFADMRLRMFAFGSVAVVFAVAYVRIACGWCLRFVWRGRGVNLCKLSAHWISVGLGLPIAHCQLSICPLA